MSQCGICTIDKAYLKFPALTTSVIFLSILQLVMFREQLNEWIVLDGGGCQLDSCQRVQALWVRYPLWGAGLNEMKGNWEENLDQAGIFAAILIFRPSLTTIPLIIRSTASVISASGLQE